MAFIAQMGGDLKPGKTREFVEWLNNNEKELANAHPQGTKYLGTYFSIYSSEKQGGSVHTFIEMENYGAQDALAAAGNDPDSLYGKLLNEAIGFFDQTSSNWTQALYKRATAATLYGED
jgi:hypothetical protein